MKFSNLQIRIATPDDAPALLEIYEPYVKETAISFEHQVPNLLEFRNRMEKTLQKYPYLVAEADGHILGYAYTGPLKSRAAYERNAETSIYVRADAHHKGLGRRLYEVLAEISKAQNILTLNACITYPLIEDEYLTRNSADFHAHLGFVQVGHFHQCGYKFSRWYDMIWMEKHLGEHSSCPASVIPFPQLPKETLTAILRS